METWAQHWCVGAGVECCRAQLPAQLLYQAVDVAWPRLCQVQPPCLSSLGIDPRLHHPSPGGAARHEWQGRRSAAACRQHAGPADPPRLQHQPAASGSRCVLLSCACVAAAVMRRSGNPRAIAARSCSTASAVSVSTVPAPPPAGVCDALAAAIRQHEDPALQRRAAAALGELLFYADSQVGPYSFYACPCHGCLQCVGPLSKLNPRAQFINCWLLHFLQHRETAAPAWDLAADGVQRLAALLQAGQDEVSQVGCGWGNPVLLLQTCTSH